MRTHVCVDVHTSLLARLFFGAGGDLAADLERSLSTHARRARKRGKHARARALLGLPLRLALRVPSCRADEVNMCMDMWTFMRIRASIDRPARSYDSHTH